MTVVDVATLTPAAVVHAYVKVCTPAVIEGRIFVPSDPAENGDALSIFTVHDPAFIPALVHERTTLAPTAGLAGCAMMMDEDG